jgi:leucyl aminopeptidase
MASLKIQSKHAAPTEIAADVLAVGVVATGKKGDFGPAVAALDEALEGALGKAIAKEEFSAKRGQSVEVQTLGRIEASVVVLHGLGEAEALKGDGIRTFAAKAARSAQASKATTLALVVPEVLEKASRTIGEGLELGVYRFTKYFTGDRVPKSSLEKVTVVPATKPTAEWKKQLELGQKIGAAINHTRDLGNEPPNTLFPASYAEIAAKMCKENGIECKVFDFKEIQRRGMKLIQAVGQGSVNEPRFVHMTYTPTKKAKKKIVLIGKGITFDSGGLSIKPAPGMGDMKSDMSGAGNLIGFMQAIAALEPAVEVHAIAPLAENMPDGKAYRPGDIWGSFDGKTVEIVNTDAEGRLLLADALAYARALQPDLLIDNATLTGACVVALGANCSAFYATTDEAAAAFQKAVEAAGENMWRMPLLEDLRDQVKSDVADVKQAGDRMGGSITAALFLREFIGDQKHWIHVDIAGPAFADKAFGWSPKGATGHGVLTFLALVEQAAG